MSNSQNINHGVLLPELVGGENVFDLSKRQKKGVFGGGGPHRAAPLDKSVAVHKRASTCESLVDVYPEAISIGGILGSSDDRLNMAFAAWMSILATLMGYYGVSIFGFKYLITWMISLPASIFLTVGCIYFFRVAYFTPKDAPVILNRSTKEVTFSQLDFPKYWEFWKIPKFKSPVTVAWSTVYARSYKFTQYMGSTIRDSYRLEIWAPDPADGRKLLVREPIGYLASYGDETLWSLYEHIRRYMEEGGPPIQKGETLRKAGRGTDASPFPEHILQNLGGPRLTPEEVEVLAQETPINKG